MAEGATIELSRGDVQKTEVRHGNETHHGFERQEYARRTQAKNEFITQRAKHYLNDTPPNRMQVLADLIDYVDIDVKDILNDETISTADRGKKAKAIKKIGDFASNIVTGEMTEDQEQETKAYITEHLHDEQQKYGGIPRMFEEFLKILPEETFDKEIEVAKAQENLLKTSKQEQFPESLYKPDQANRVLDALAEQGAEVTFDSVDQFLTASKHDLEAQRRVFENENKGLITVVDKAVEFAKDENNKLDLESGKMIAVTEKGGETIVDWEDKLLDSENEIFYFDPRADAEDPYSLGRYVQLRRQFDDKLDGPRGGAGVNNALQLIEELKEGTDVEISGEELLSIQEVIERHEKYLETLDETENVERQTKVLDNLTGMVRSRNLDAKDEEDAQVPEKTKRRSFSRAGKTLKGLNPLKKRPREE